jgi:hypothetical protein
VLCCGGQDWLVLLLRLHLLLLLVMLVAMTLLVTQQAKKIEGTRQGMAALVVFAFASAGEAAVQYIRRTTKAEQRSAGQGSTTPLSAADCSAAQRRAMQETQHRAAQGRVVEVDTVERSAGRWRIMQHTAAQRSAARCSAARCRRHSAAQNGARDAAQHSAGGRSHITEAAQGDAIHHPRTQRRAMSDDASAVRGRAV